MKLLRFYFEVGGESFDAASFALAADENDLDGAVSTISNNSKTLKRWGRDEHVSVHLATAHVATDAEVADSAVSQWCSGLLELDAGTESTPSNSPQWLAEESQLLDFIEQIKCKLPPVADFCDGEYFMLLRLIYAAPGVGLHYSETLMRSLAELNAGLSIDCE